MGRDELERLTEKRSKRREAGLCWHCGGSPEPGRRSCRKALDQALASENRKRDRRLADGRCIECGEGPPATGQRRCEACVRKCRAAVAATRARYRAAGACTRCGYGTPAEPRKRVCAACAEKDALRSAGYKARQKSRPNYSPGTGEP